MPALNLQRTKTASALKSTSHFNEKSEITQSPNFGESALLTAGDECKNVDFFSATRSNNDLKDML